MRSILKTILCATTGLTSTAMAADRVQMTPGRWHEVFSFTAMTVGGRPIPVDSLHPPDPVRFHCIGPEEAANPRLYFAASEAGADCKRAEEKVEDGRLAIKLQCKLDENAPVTMVLEGTYGPQSYRLIGNGHGTLDGKPLALSTAVDGKFVGVCTGDEK